jgi:hypothetical protein
MTADLPIESRRNLGPKSGQPYKMT